MNELKFTASQKNIRWWSSICNHSFWFYIVHKVYHHHFVKYFKTKSFDIHSFLFILYKNTSFPIKVVSCVRYKFFPNLIEMSSFSKNKYVKSCGACNRFIGESYGASTFGRSKIDVSELYMKKDSDVVEFHCFFQVFWRLSFVRPRWNWSPY